MLHLYQNNRTENLFATLAENLATPLQSVFQPEIIVVEEPGMSRWLSQKLAEISGITANTQFPLPAAFIWQVINAQLGAGHQDNIYSKPVLQWIIMDLLPELADTPGFEVVSNYLDEVDRETRLYQLSKEVADLFDQYLVFRPDWFLFLEGVEQAMPLEFPDTADAQWQFALWQHLRSRIDSDHWPLLLKSFLHSVQTDGLRNGVLPERISLFSLSSFSSGYMELLLALGKHTEVHLYLLNPCEHYWGDISDEKKLARLRDYSRKAGQQDVSGVYETGNSLLGAMGVSRRDMFDLWIERESEICSFHAQYETAEGSSQLKRIQNDILTLNQTTGDVAFYREGDQSVQVHSCFSSIREVQVLHDRLLALFDADENLHPDEVLVLVPDINTYSPVIEAVFGAVPTRRKIPFSVSGTTELNHPLSELLLQWLGLGQERFEASAVISWLELPAVQRRFNLDENGLERIRQWVKETGIRWGLDSEHKAALGLPASDMNTWAFGLRRLYLGYAMRADSELYSGVAPYGMIEGGEAQWLGELQNFIDRLRFWQSEFNEPATPDVWQKRLLRLIEQMLEPDDEESVQLDAFRRQVSKFTEQTRLAGFDQKISASLFQQHLESMLQSSGTHFNLLSGTVTFTSLTPARSIPFKVICLLGMNDGVFPRTQRPPGFDLMQNRKRKGDRDLRDDDRFLFLEALLSAREVFHVSYIGSSQQDNSEKQPSVVVSELIDYIARSAGLDLDSLPEDIFVRQPLQPFSTEVFRRGSYAQEWQLISGQNAEAPFYSEPLPEGSARSEINLEDLSEFLVNPAKCFLQGLGIQAADYDDVVEDVELFSADTLQAYNLKSALLEMQLGAVQEEDCFKLLAARGELPHGLLARETFISLRNQVAGQNEALFALAERAGKVDFYLDLAEVGIQVSIGKVVNDGALSYRPSGLKPKDWLRLWVRHLALNAAGKAGESVHVGSDKELKLQPLAPGQALLHLEALVALYQQGQNQLVPLPENAAMAFANHYHKNQDREEALRKAKVKWPGSEFSKGDSDDKWNAMAFRDSDPFDEAFVLASMQVWQPILVAAKIRTLP